MKKFLKSFMASMLVLTAITGCGAAVETAKTTEDTPEASTATESATAEGTSETKESAFTKDTVILGCDVSFAPMAFQDGDNIVGFDIDLANEVFENRMGKNLEIQPIDWSSKEAELDTEKIDVIWNGLTITDDRKEKMCFTKAYMENKQMVIVRKDSAINTLEDLKGKVIGMQKESTAVDAFKESGIEAETVELKDNVSCLNELQTERVDAVIMDSVVGNYYLTIQPDQYDFKVLDETLAEELYGIAVKKGNDAFRDEIQAALDECIADGTAAKIATKWFGKDTIYTGK